MNDSSSPNRWGPFWPLGEALRFLTIVPIRGLPPTSDTSIGRAVPFFPLAGLLIGGALVLLGIVAGWLWGPLLRSCLIVVGWAVITAGLHLDGLSDTFDGVLSWRPRERKLEIMRDSRIGVMGAIALGVALLLKVAFLLAAGDAWLQAMLLAPMFGRWAASYGIIAFPPAREGGLGRAFQEHVERREIILVSAMVLIIALLIADGRGMLACLAVVVVAHWLGRWWTRELGGLTGDTYGALCELCEIVVLAVCSALR